MLLETLIVYVGSEPTYMWFYGSTSQTQNIINSKMNC